jgi:hypothetical protein
VYKLIDLVKKLPFPQVKRACRQASREPFCKAIGKIPGKPE